MGKSKPVTLGNECFAKKGDLRDRIHQLLKSYQVMEFIDGIDKELCLHLFKYHPSYLIKLGSGIEAIQIRLNDEYRSVNRCFHIHRVDGTDEEISWTKCYNSI